jgi:hypothetical protein
MLIEKANLRTNMGLAARQMAADFDIAVLGKRLCNAIKSCIGSNYSGQNILPPKHRED